MTQTLKQVIATDNVFKFGKDEYGTQCSQWNWRMTLKELKTYYKREYNIIIKN